MKVWLLILLLANLLVAGFVFIAETRVSPAAPGTDLNADRMRFVPLPREPVPTKAAESPARLVCLQWSGIAGADLRRARELLAPLVPFDHIVESRTEEASRFWVNIPPAANASATVARLKESGVKDVSLEPNNAISLGLFNTEESARGVLTQLHGKGFTQARIEPRSLQVKEAALTVREPGAEVVRKLGEFKAQFSGSSVQPVDCPAGERTG